MDRMERREQIERSGTDAHKAKLIFFSLITLVAVILVWSLAAAGRARSERNAVGLELDAARQDNMKLQQTVRDLNRENRGLRKKVQQLEAKIKSTSAGSKKKSSRKKTRKKKQVLLYN